MGFEFSRPWLATSIATHLALLFDQHAVKVLTPVTRHEHCNCLCRPRPRPRRSSSHARDSPRALQHPPA